MNVVNFNVNEKNSANMQDKIQTKNYFKKFLFGGCVINSVLCFSYLIMLNSLATRGFDLEELKIKKIQIQKEIEAIDISLAIPTSLYALESNESVQLMPNIESKKFFEVHDGELAYVNTKQY